MKSTIGNISLIQRFRQRPNNYKVTHEEKIFEFWMEFFVEATKSEEELGDTIRFPVRLIH